MGRISRDLGMHGRYGRLDTPSDEIENMSGFEVAKIRFPFPSSSRLLYKHLVAHAQLCCHLARRRTTIEEQINEFSKAAMRVSDRLVLT